MPDSDAVSGAPRPQSASLGLGERLRSARKARAVSVAQVAAALNIEEPAVLALEEERFEALGAPVFVRGHLRRYAQLVGLAPEAVIEAYRTMVPDSDALPLVARRRERADMVALGPWVYWVVAALVIVGIVIAVGGRDDAAPAQAVTDPPTTVDTPPAARGLPQPDLQVQDDTPFRDDGSAPQP